MSLSFQNNTRPARIRRLSPPGCAVAAALVDAAPIALPIVGGTDAVHGRGSGDPRGRLRVELHQHARTGGHLLHGGQHQHAKGDDRLVGQAEMLARAVLDRSLRFDGPLVVNVDVLTHSGIGAGLLLIDVEAVVVEAPEARLVVGRV